MRESGANNKHSLKELSGGRGGVDGLRVLVFQGRQRFLAQPPDDVRAVGRRVDCDVISYFLQVAVGGVDVPTDVAGVEIL